MPHCTMFSATGDARVVSPREIACVDPHAPQKPMHVAISRRYQLKWRLYAFVSISIFLPYKLFKCVVFECFLLLWWDGVQLLFKCNKMKCLSFTTWRSCTPHAYVSPIGRLRDKVPGIIKPPNLVGTPTYWSDMANHSVDSY